MFSSIQGLDKNQKSELLVGKAKHNNDGAKVPTVYSSVNMSIGSQSTEQGNSILGPHVLRPSVTDQKVVVVQSLR